jgi:hypothetical protein
LGTHRPEGFPRCKNPRIFGRCFFNFLNGRVVCQTDVGEILSLVSPPPTTLRSSSNLGPKGSVISFQERPECRIILHFLEFVFPDTRTEGAQMAGKANHDHLQRHSCSSAALESDRKRERKRDGQNVVGVWREQQQVHYCPAFFPTFRFLPSLKWGSQTVINHWLLCVCVSVQSALPKSLSLSLSLSPRVCVSLSLSFLALWPDR